MDSCLKAKVYKPVLNCSFLKVDKKPHTNQECGAPTRSVMWACLLNYQFRKVTKILRGFKAMIDEEKNKQKLHRRSNLKI